MPPRSQKALQFLRPLALPQSATVRSLLRFSTSIPKLSTQHADAKPLDSHVPPQIAPKVPNITPADSSKPSKVFTEKRALKRADRRTMGQGLHPYWMQRTASGNLPVYREVKRGGNLKLVVLRRLFGDLQQLSQDLRAELDPEGSEPHQIEINALTSQVLVKVSTSSCIAGRSQASRN